MADRIHDPAGARHPQHHAVSQQVRSWYTAPVPEIGLHGTADWYGFACMTGDDRARIVLSIADPGEAAAALAAAQAACPAAASFVVLVDDRDRAARLDAALRARGCRNRESTTYLALTGPIGSTAAGPDGLEMPTVGTEELATWARVKLQSFADSEDPPAAAAVGTEVDIRRSELPLAEYRLCLLDAEPVAVLGHYPGDDDLVFVLGTRTPFRHRGIAQAMLARWVATTAGARSHMINATDGGAPAALYRRLGFTDEVYWYRKYELTR